MKYLNNLRFLLIISILQFIMSCQSGGNVMDYETETKSIVARVGLIKELTIDYMKTRYFIKCVESENCGSNFYLFKKNKNYTILNTGNNTYVDLIELKKNTTLEIDNDSYSNGVSHGRLELEIDSIMNITLAQ